jgi:hypothetical protein
MWLHILMGLLGVCTLYCSEVDSISEQCNVHTTVTLASTSNELPDDGVTASKHVRAVLMLI